MQPTPSNTATDPKSGRFSHGGERGASTGSVSSWLPSKADVEKQQQAAWAQMRESSGPEETEASGDDGKWARRNRAALWLGLAGVALFYALVWVAVSMGSKS